VVTKVTREPEKMEDRRARWREKHKEELAAKARERRAKK
jgi:hypothetical protein